MTAKDQRRIYTEPQKDEILRQHIQDDSEIEIVRALSAWKQEMSYIQSLREQGPVVGHRLWRREELYER